MIKTKLNLFSNIPIGSYDTGNPHDIHIYDTTNLKAPSVSDSIPVKPTTNIPIQSTQHKPASMPQNAPTKNPSTSTKIPTSSLSEISNMNSNLNKNPTPLTQPLSFTNFQTSSYVNSGK